MRSQTPFSPLAGIPRLSILVPPKGPAVTVDPEKLLLKSLDDLRSRLAAGRHYDMLRAAAIIRQLILDTSPLVHAANRAHQLKIRFLLPSATPIDGTDRDFALRGYGGGPGPRREASLDDFLAYDILRLNADVYTTRDIIRAAALKEGGVHFEGQSEPRLVRLSEYRFETDGVSIYGGTGAGAEPIPYLLQQIALKLLDALAPLEAHLRNSVNSTREL
jgi:hypothetical protein